MRSSRRWDGGWSRLRENTVGLTETCKLLEGGRGEEGVNMMYVRVGGRSSGELGVLYINHAHRDTLLPTSQKTKTFYFSEKFKNYK